MKAVSIIYRSFIFLIVTCLVSETFAQNAPDVNMKTMITIEKKEARFDAFLNSVSRQSGVVFSFSTTRIAADKILTLTPGQQTLETFLNQLKGKTGLDYKIVGTHIIFLDKHPAPVATQSTRTISRSVNKTSSVKPLSKGKQTQTISSADTKIPAVNSGENKQAPERIANEAGPKEKTDSTRLLQKDDTLAQKQDITIDSVLMNAADSLSAKKIDTSSSKETDTGAIGRTVVNGGNNSPGNSLRASNGRAERTESKTIWFIGAQISRITGFENQNETFSATGLGAVIKMENSISKKFSWTVGLGFDNFMGSYTYTRFSGSPGDTTAGTPKDTTIDNFAIAPLLMGLKFYYRKFYLSAEMGLAFKASSATRTKLALAPSIGVLLPSGSNNSIDISLRFTHIVAGYGIPESNGLENGGYGFLSIRAAYGIGGSRFKKRS